MTSPTSVPSSTPVWSAPSMRADPGLLRRIQAHPLDKLDAALPFSKRLAEENGWPHPYALRVIEEYRRFIYLVCIASEELTPSDEVDQVWHLHLAYSRDYWDEFCAKVLQRPLHHAPTEGGPDERGRYEGNYRRTRDLYSQAFRTAPPPDIWPPAKIRFDPKARFAPGEPGAFQHRAAPAAKAEPAGALVPGGVRGAVRADRDDHPGGHPGASFRPDQDVHL